MSLIEITVYSRVLMQERDITVVLPELDHDPAKREGHMFPKCQTLYLLHGLTDDNTIFTRRSLIERFASEYHLALIMPNADRSYYTDMAEGEPYFEHITRELPRICQSLFPMLSDKREDRFVCGMSMGGYGALKCALRASDVFSYCAALSAVTDVAAEEKNDGRRGQPWRDIFGEASQVKGSFNDLFKAAEDYAADRNAEPIHLYMWCGQEDVLYPENVRFKEHLQKLNYDFVWEESHGLHSWNNWNEQLKTVLNWLPLIKGVR